MIAPQEGAPAQLVPPTTHGLDLLTAATLLNRSDKTVISYRIGWGYQFRRGTTSRSSISLEVMGRTPFTRDQVLSRPCAMHCAMHIRTLRQLPARGRRLKSQLSRGEADDENAL